jgi:CheY-like chemotaxis protein
MLRILVIEDDALIRGVLSRILEACGYAVTQVADGPTGLGVCREQGADLVLTDLQMPGMNGIEVITQLRAFAPNLPVIVMSAEARSGDLDPLGDAERLGVAGVLAKPFNREALTQLVAAAFRRHEESKE